jgi:WD40 repeat protein
VGGFDGSVQLYEPDTGRLVQALLAESMPLYALTWSPDGRVLAGGTRSDESRPVHLWDAETGRLLRALESPRPFTAHAVAWSPDGRKVLALDEWTSVCLVWSAADGKFLREVAIPCTGPVFSPDGSRVAGARNHAALIWDTETGQEVRNLGKVEGHVAWSPDGKRLACAGADALHVWDAATGKEMIERKDLAGADYPRWSPDGRTLALSRRGQPFLLLELAPESTAEQELDTFASFGVWSPDGKSVALMPASGGIDLFDVATGKRARSLCNGKSWPLGYALSPDGQTVALADGSHETFLASADTGRFFAELKDTTRPLVWSPDGKHLAAGGTDHAVVIWDSAGHGRRALAGHKADVTELAWSPDGKHLASAAAGEKRLLVWDTEKGERFREPGPFAAEMETHFYWGIPVGSLSWSPDGRLLAFNVPGPGWHIWDVERGQRTNDPKQWKLAHFDFAPDGRNALVYAPSDGAFQLRDLATGEVRGRLPYGQTSPVWSRDGRLLAMPWESQIELWSGDLRRRLRTLTGMSRVVAQVTFTGDGKLVAGLGWGGLHIWETATGRLRGILQLPGQGRDALTVSAEGHYAGNGQVQPDIVMLVQKADGSSEVLEPADFEHKYGFKNDPGKVHLVQPPPPSLPPEPVSPLALVQEPARLPGVRSWTIATRDASGSLSPDSLAYRPDGRRLATASWDGSVRIYDPETGRLVQVLLAESSPLTSLAWSPDGRVLAGGSQSDERRPVQLWDAETGRLLRALETPNGATATVLAWSSDGRHLVAFDHLQGVCRAWSVSDGRLLRTVAIPCERAVLSPDGGRVAGVRNHHLFVWDAGTGQEVRGFGKSEGNVAWSPDGKRLACAGAEALHVWGVETGKQIIRRQDLANSGFPQWSPDGRTLALSHSSPSGRFLMLDVNAAGAAGREFDTGAWFTVWSPDGKTVALKADGALDLFDVVTGKRTRRLIEPRYGPAGFAWSPDARTLAVLDSNARAFLASADTGRFLTDLKESTGPLAWSPDGRYLAAAGPHQAVVLWESGGKKRRTLTGHRADVAALAWSPDGKHLASAAAGEKRLLVWDAENGRRFREVGPFATDVQTAWSRMDRGVWRHLAWSPDGTLLAFNLPAVGWHVWDVEQNRLANDPKQWQVDRFDFAPDGRTALVYSETRGVGQLRDLATGERRGPYSLGAQFIPAWSPGGHWLALPWGPEIELWRGDLSGRVRTLTATYRYLTQVAFSGDGRLLAVQAWERLHLFETDTGRLRGILLPGHGRDGLAISRDGHYACDAEVKRNLVVVVQKEDGTSEVLEPADFERRYGFKNDPDKVHLLQPPPP